jgi:hypothetical protein
MARRHRVGLFLSAALFLLLIPCPAFAAFTYARSVTIDATKVPATQTNFTVLVCANSAAPCDASVSGLNQSGGGAHVTQADADDIVFTSDNACTTLLSWEIERYAPSTGELVAWVKVASVSSSSDTVIYMCYGDSGTTMFQGGSTGAAWDSAYTLVAHLGDGTTLSGNDSTSNGNNLTPHGSWPGAAGKIGGGTELSNPSSNQYFDNTTIASSNSVTIAFWNNVATGDERTDTVFDYPIGEGSPDPRLSAHAPFTDLMLYWDYGNATNNDGRVFTDYTAYMDAWTWVVLTYDNASGDHKVFLNGTQAVSNTHSVSNPGLSQLLVNVSSGLLYGKRKLDEFTILSAAKDSNWVTATYNNQNNPGAFLAFGSEGAPGGGGGGGSTAFQVLRRRRN